jgi:hypothetical protein
LLGIRATHAGHGEQCGNDDKRAREIGHARTLCNFDTIRLKAATRALADAGRKARRTMRATGVPFVAVRLTREEYNRSLHDYDCKLQ